MFSEKDKTGLIQWAEALESGKYEQGQDFLLQKGISEDTVDMYCCLGVACDIDLTRDQDDLNEMCESFCGLTFHGNTDKNKNDPFSITWFSKANDEWGLTFFEIAQAIRYMINNQCSPKEALVKIHRGKK